MIKLGVRSYFHQLASSVYEWNTTTSNENITHFTNTFKHRKN